MSDESSTSTKINVTSADSDTSTSPGTSHDTSRSESTGPSVSSSQSTRSSESSSVGSILRYFPDTVIQPNPIDDSVKMLKTEVEFDKFKQVDIHERLKVVESMISSNESLLSLLSVDPMRIPKSNEESLACEAKGDFEKGNKAYDDALDSYNKSIAFAETDYPYFYRLYGKRAASLFEKKLFKACLHNIDLAIESCPTFLRDDYVQQKNSYTVTREIFKTIHDSRMSKYQSKIDGLTKLTYEKHPNVPFIVNCLEFTDTPNYGRGIQTNTDLKPGDVVAIDKAYASILLNGYQYRHCSNCLKENWSLIPCPDCTTVMYCNQKCLQIAWKKFHKHECKISNYLSKMLTDMIEFRVPLQTIELFGGIDPLIEFEEMSQQVDRNSFNVFNVDHRDIRYDNDDDDDDDDDGGVVQGAGGNVQNFNSKMKPLNYHPIHAVIKDAPELSNWTIDAYLHTTILTFVIYRLFRDIFNIATDNQKHFIEKFIYRHVRAARIYEFGLVKTTDDDYDVRHIKSIFPFTSYVNHSCVPNIAFFTSGSSVIIIAIGTIEANTQLFMDYGVRYLSHSKDERQKSLLSTFNFICQCVACKEKCAVFSKLPIFSSLPFPICRPSQQLTLEQLIETIISLFEFRAKNCTYYPCVEMCSYEGKVRLYLNCLLRRLAGAIYVN